MTYTKSISVGPRALLAVVTLAGLLALATLVSGIAGLEDAEAGTYPVYACEAAGVNANRSWVETGAGGHRAYTRCPTNGDRNNGIATRIIGTVGRGARAQTIFYAPAGTTIAGFNWRGRWNRTNCSWKTAMEMWPHTGVIIGGRAEPGNNWCPANEDTVHDFGAGGFFGGLDYRNTVLTQVTECVARRCTGGGTFHTYAATVTIHDPSAPALGFAGGGLLSGRWVRGTQSAVFNASDNTGIRQGILRVDGGVRNWANYACDFARPTPCANKWGAALGFDTRGVSDGRHTVTVRVADSGLNVRDAARYLYVDNTAPGRVGMGVGGGEGWRRSSRFRVAWRNAERWAPVTAARYVLCREGAGARGCQAQRRVAASTLYAVQPPGPGNWRLTTWREDAAGNQDANTADTRFLRYDPDPPSVSLDGHDTEDPLRVSAGVGDGVSGVAGGEIEMRRRGASTWHDLGARLEGSRLVARVDDERFPDGAYELRARSVDRAGNEASTGRRSDGRAASFGLPARIVIGLRAGVRKRVVKRVRVRHGGRRLVVRRRVVRLVSLARVRYRRSVTIAGSLANRDGQPLDHAPLNVLSQPRAPGSPFTLVGQVRTDSKGRFRYRAKASESRTIRFDYRGAPKLKATRRDVRLLVPASSSLRVNPRRVFNGGIIRLIGRVRGGPIPSGGKLLHLQARYRGRWRTFQVLRTNAGGRWSTNYTFGATSGRVVYPFRAVMPFEAVFPFERGHTRTVKVVVSGR